MGHKELLFFSFAASVAFCAPRGFPKPYFKNIKKSRGYSHCNARCQRPVIWSRSRSIRKIEIHILQINYAFGDYMERKTSNITSTTIEDDTEYQSTLAFILLTDVVDGRSIYEDMNSLSDNELNEKIKNVIRYTFRRRVLDELYGSDVGAGDLAESAEGLSDKRWNAVLKRSDLKWDQYREYVYKFEKDKCKGFFVSDKGAEVDMFFAEYTDKVHSDSGALIYTKDGRKIPLSSGLLHRIDTIFEIGDKPGVSLTERMKKKSFEEHAKRAERDLYEK